MPKFESFFHFTLPSLVNIYLTRRLKLYVYAGFKTCINYYASERFSLDLWHFYDILRLQFSYPLNFI
ncbi:unnamed protein product [Rhizophagus irregularis]|nr:unnamed protein product [Rhizophagus irregularis]